jgi:hypothetical protein
VEYENEKKHISDRASFMNNQYNDNLNMDDNPSYPIIVNINILKSQLAMLEKNHFAKQAIETDDIKKLANDYDYKNAKKQFNQKIFNLQLAYQQEQQRNTLARQEMVKQGNQNDEELRLIHLQQRQQIQKLQEQQQQQHIQRLQQHQQQQQQRQQQQQQQRQQQQQQKEHKVRAILQDTYQKNQSQFQNELQPIPFNKNNSNQQTMRHNSSPNPKGPLQPQNSLPISSRGSNNTPSTEPNRSNQSVGRASLSNRNLNNSNVARNNSPVTSAKSNQIGKVSK